MRALRESHDTQVLLLLPAPPAAGLAAANGRGLLLPSLRRPRGGEQQQLITKLSRSRPRGGEGYEGGLTSLK
jgi:hypothetical protein